jgi:hypothetical protein
MIKIFNLDMAIHFLKNNEDRKLFSCGIFQDNNNEITYKNLDDLRKLKEDKEHSWMYQYYTQNLGGKKWDKYAELDVFDVEKDMFGKYPGWESESEFLYLGYSSVVNRLKEKIQNLEIKVKNTKESGQRYFEENSEYQEMIRKMANDFEIDCPSEIKEKLQKEYDIFEDNYKSSFYILPDTKVAKNIEKQLEKYSFIFYKTNIIDGWYAVWSYGD